MNQTDDYWQAMVERDTSKRGQFICAVKTTGIYCAPGCPARPKRENVVFYNTTTEARDAGFRACKRCKPDEPFKIT